jgi:hypothetical protein
MLHKIFGRFLAGWVAALALCLPAVADVVFDDFEDGNTQNVYGRYWYAYQNDYTAKDTLWTFDIAAGSAGATTGYHAEMAFKGLTGAGEDWAAITLGSDLTESGAIGSDFSNVQSITFWVKGPKGLNFYFYAQTKENDDGNSNKFGKLFKIEDDNWNKYTVGLTGTDTDFKQDAPYTGGAKFTFSRTNITKFAWTLKKKGNTVTNGTFAIDDVTLVGNNIPDPTPPVTPPSNDDLCVSCMSGSFTVPTPSVLLTDFESAKNTLDYYSYSYKNTASDLESGSEGRERDGYSVDFAVKGTNVNDRYAGIGINLSDNAVTVPLNASTFTGIYLEYKTTGIEKVRVEVIDKAGALDPKGEDFYIYLPATNGVWKSATIPFTALFPPSWVKPAPSFNKSNLAKINIATKTLGTGTIAVDNVYFLGASRFPNQKKYALTYAVNLPEGGCVQSGSGVCVSSLMDSVFANETGPAVTAKLSSDQYRFVSWADGDANVTRIDVATSDMLFTAIFDRIPVPIEEYTITYKAGTGGGLSVNGGDKVLEYKVKLQKGQTGPIVAALGDLNPPSVFKGWSDGSKEASRTDVVLSDTTFTAEFEAYVAPPTVVRVTYTAGEGGGVGIIAKNDILYSILMYKDITKQGAVIARGAGFPMCVDSLLPGDSITVTAWPDSGDINYTFLGWSDGVKTATRVDKYEGGDVNVTAFFVNDVIPPETPFAVLAYSAGSGGKLKADNDDLTASVTRSVVIDSAGPTVTAVPDDGYKFVKWSDGVTTAVRADTAKAAMNGTLMVEAEFALINVSSQTFRLLYFAGSGGKLIVGSGTNSVASYDTTVVIGTDASAVTAKPDSGYVFAQWSDGSTQNPRFNLSIQANVSVTAAFRKQTSVATPSREIPKAPTTEITAVAPIIVNANGFTTGPNPTAAAVKFFITGRTIKTGKLSIYDASGNLVKTIKLSDNGTAGKRSVGSWNLKDSRGRQVATGSYAVKGTITTKNGVTEKVSTIIAVVK